MGEAPNMYPNLMKLLLIIIKDYFIAEIHERELTSK